MRAEVIDVEAVDARLEAAWDALAADAAEPNPFNQPQCVLPAARLLADAERVGLLVVWSADRLVFLLPVRRVRRYRRLPIATVMWWRHPYAFLATPLVASGVDAASVWDTALDHLAESGEGGALALELFPLDGPVADGLMARTGPGRPVLFESYDRAVVVRRPEPTYLDGRLSPRRRKSLRRYERRLEEELGGTIRVRDHARAGDEAFDRAVEGFLAQEAAGWKGTDGGAFACRPGDARFFRELAAGFRRSGQLELWSLGTDESVAAYQVNLVAGDTTFHFKVSYDEGLSKWSPGLQLEVAMVDAFHGDPRLQRIDSCTAPGTTVSEQLYPDRRPIGFLLVPLAGGWRRAVVASAPRLASAYQRLRRRPVPVPAHVGGDE